MFNPLKRFRYGLDRLLLVVWLAIVCVTCIVVSRNAEIISAGVFGLVLLLSHVIAAVARANIDPDEPTEE